MAVKLQVLNDGVEGIFIKNNRFNTTLISYNFLLPIKKETAASYALIPFILTSCGKKYPDFRELNYKLAKLYGARLNASVEKQGNCQLLKMTISVINDRFSLENDSLVKSASDLLLRLIFEPNVENGAFMEKDLNREKRKAIEHIKGEFSEKQVYAKKRLIEEMFKNDPYGIPKCGTVEDVEAITGEGLYKSWQDMLKTAFIRINVVGAQMPSGLFEEITERFSTVERKNITDIKNVTQLEPAKQINSVTEHLDVSQSKLCMGFSSKVFGNDDTSLPLLVMNDILGGGPYSGLFSNVREKLSLCYYCSARSVRAKGMLMVSSGLEAENCQKAEKEILNQLDIIKDGKFEDNVFDSSIKSITDSFMSYYDSQISLDLWYTVKIDNDRLYSPEDICEMLKKITKEDIINTAKGVNLHTVYKLLPKEAN